MCQIIKAFIGGLCVTAGGMMVTTTIIGGSVFVLLGCALCFWAGWSFEAKSKLREDHAEFISAASCSAKTDVKLSCSVDEWWKSGEEDIYTTSGQ